MAWPCGRIVSEAVDGRHSSNWGWYMSKEVRRVPKQDRARRSVAAILDATAELLGEEATPITMSAIGERAGISKAAIYRYFPDQTAVIHELAVRYLGELDGHLEAELGAVQSVDEVVVALSRVVDLFHDLMREEPAMRRIWLGGANSVVVSELIAQAAHKIAVQIHGVLAPHLRDEHEINLVRVELMVYMARGAVEMALNEPGTPVMREFKRSLILMAGVADDRTIEMIEALGSPVAAPAESPD